MTLEELVLGIAERHKRLEELKEHSPEIAEALEVAEEYRRLYSELEERCKTPPYVPVPYPVYPQPVYPWNNPTWITATTDKTTNVKPYQVISSEVRY